MRRHSFLRLGSYTPIDESAPGGGTVIITPGEDSVWNTDTGTPLRSLVYISDSNEVSPTSASALETMMGIGFVSSIDGALASVKSSGELAGFTGLVPGGTYYAASAEGEIWTPTDESPNFPTIVQVVGRAKNETTLFISINPGPFISLQ